VFQLITGFGDTGAALCQAGVDKLAFTGSTATGKKISGACADTASPRCSSKCGGKDALIVAGDADLDAAVDATVWGGMSNAGPDLRRRRSGCTAGRVGVRRLRGPGDARGGPGPWRATTRPAQYGPMTMPAQIDVVRRHIDDALARGGRAVVGGPDSVQPPYVQPVVLVDVPEDSAAVQEETFGPTLTITKVRDVDEGDRARQRQPVRLGGAVFSAKQGEQIADRLSCGMVASTRRSPTPPCRDCRSGAYATPASDGSTARTVCASSPGPAPSPPALPVAAQGADLQAHPARRGLAQASRQDPLG